VPWEDGQPIAIEETYGDGDERGLTTQNLINGVLFETKDGVSHEDLPREFIDEIIDFLKNN
jgi:hypothetical protein